MAAGRWITAGSPQISQAGVRNRAVRTILRFDRRHTLRFAALGRDFARDVTARHPQLQGIDSAV